MHPGRDPGGGARAASRWAGRLSERVGELAEGVGAQAKEEMETTTAEAEECHGPVLVVRVVHKVN